MKLLLLFSIIVLLSFNLGAQSVGASIGGGVISGNSPDVSSVTTTLFFETPGLFSNSFSLRLSFLYAADYNQIIPNSTNRYNPFIRGISLKGITSQNMTSSFYLDEGIGILMIDDRIFDGLSAVDYGLLISVGAGIDLRNFSPSGFKIGAGADFGFTFTNTYAKYISVHIMGQYYF